MPIDTPGMPSCRVWTMKTSQSHGNRKSSSTRRGDGTRVGQPATLQRNHDTAETMTVSQGQGQIAPVTPIESSDDKPPFRARLLEALRTSDGEAAVRILGQVASTSSSGDQGSRLNCALDTLLGIHPRDQLEA